MGPKIIETILAYFNSDDFKNLEAQLAADPSLLNIQDTEVKELGDAFAGQTFVITGTLSESRGYFEKLVKDNGGKVSSSVSKKTAYLLCGEAAGSKLDKAKSLGVRVLSEAEFNQLLN